MTRTAALPVGVSVFERGWLSSNCILLADQEQAVLVDSGYATHSDQTLLLVRSSLGSRPLDKLWNTHLHSDHCGGNAALQSRYPALQTAVPPGMADKVRDWDPIALGYVPIGQECPRFTIDAVLEAGTELAAAGGTWQVHASPGHDAHSVILFEPESATLVSADALWENGFGVVFQEIEGEHAFDEVGRTLDLIEALDPVLVIPGHGSTFSSVTTALASARRRLESFACNPRKHALHAAKVLLKFRLLEKQEMTRPDMLRWARSTPYMNLIACRWFPEVELDSWMDWLSEQLIHSGAARYHGDLLVNG